MTAVVTTRRWNEEAGATLMVEEEWPTVERADDGTWRIEGPGWVMAPVGDLSPDPARRICEKACDAIRFPTRSGAPGVDPA